MKIKPFVNQVYIKLNEPKVGALQTTKDSAIECAEILAIGNLSDNRSPGEMKVGDKIFVKAWAIDIISYEDKKYHFINIDSGGILARVYDK